MKTWTIRAMTGLGLGLGIVAPFTAAAATIDNADAVQAAPSFEGDWHGALDAGGKILRLALHVDGSSGTLDSLDQGVEGLPVEGIVIAGNRLTFAVPPVGGTYEGEWSDGKWVGTWSQGGGSLDLTLSPGLPKQAAVTVPETWTFPDDSVVAAKLAETIGAREGIVGAVALVGEGDPRIVTSDGFDPDGRFEIGSVTKVFTSLLLADMVLDGTVSLDDTLGDLLPDTATGSVADITLRQLSNHFSGLPRLPANIMGYTMLPDPYARYGEKELLAFVETVEPARAPGDGFEYSNAAVGLLGYLLGKADGSDYERALMERIVTPMSLTHTGFGNEDLLVGHAADTQVANWNFDALAGAGALRSTIGDMGRFAQILASPGERWSKHLALMTKEQTPTANGMSIGLGLFTIPLTDGGVLFHNGGTGGFKSSLWADPETGRGAVVLVSAGDSDPDKMGAWLISGVEPQR